jgi:hypothetical protein
MLVIHPACQVLSFEPLFSDFSVHKLIHAHTGGGSLLVVTDCLNDEFDSSIECYGSQASLLSTGAAIQFQAESNATSGELYCCYESNADYALNRLWSYMDHTTTSLPSNGPVELIFCRSFACT